MKSRHRCFASGLVTAPVLRGTVSPAPLRIVGRAAEILRLLASAERHRVLQLGECSASTTRRSRRSRSRKSDERRAMLELLIVAAMAALQNASQTPSHQTQATFDRLTRLLVTYVAAILRRMGVADRSLAEDIVQEFWVRMLTRKLAHRYNPMRSARRAPFLLGVLRMVMRETLRKAKIGRTEPLDADMVSPVLDPGATAELAEVCNEVRDAVDLLKPELADAIRGRFLGRPIPIDQTCSPGARYGRTFRAKNAVRSRLERRFGSSGPI